jgi:D-alanyl-D-alanine carboxypeptidase
MRFLFLFIVLVFFILESFSFANIQYNQTKDFVKEEEYFVAVRNNFARLPVEANAFSVYDFTLNREIYGKNSEKVLPLASLSKTMTVLVALDFYHKNDTIKISKNAVSQFGNYGFSENEEYNFSDLVKFVLIGSANDGAFALLENIGDSLGKMKIKSNALNLETLDFYNSTGLDLSPGNASSFGSALDVNKLAFYSLRKNKEIFSNSVSKEIKIKNTKGKEISIQNTNIVLDQIPNILFSKTGFTNTAGGNLSVVFEDSRGHIIGITLLGATFEGRFSEMVKIVEFVYKNYTI